MKKGLLTTTALFVFAFSSAGFANDEASDEREAATVEENTTAEVEQNENNEETTLGGLIVPIRYHSFA